ncbi:MAG: TolC family protein [Deltaproteobacteria bacterium]|nr:TolC family protein [Deltaproteobacteria bacterium]
MVKRGPDSRGQWKAALRLSRLRRVSAWLLTVLVLSSAGWGMAAQDSVDSLAVSVQGSESTPEPVSELKDPPGSSLTAEDVGPLAHPPERWQPVVFDGQTITLPEALSLTLANNPTLRLDEETARFHRGRLQEEAGQFDQRLTADLSYDYTKQNIRASVRQTEQERREDRQTSIDNLNERLIVSQQILNEILVLQQDPENTQVSDPDVQAQIDVINFQIRRASAEDRGELLVLRDQALNDAVIAARGDVDELTADLAEDRQELADLGPVPREEEEFFGRLNVQYLFPSRSGFTWGPFFEYTLDGDRFVGKPVNEDFGGKGIRELYRGTLGFTIDMPLARGFGRHATGAAERAAQFDYEASLAALRHSAAVSVLNTALAYWSAVEGEERVAVLEDSVRVQEELVELISMLIEADEVTASELSRGKAQQASSRAALEDARRFSQEARLDLADLMGLAVERQEQAPAPADPFPKLLPLGSLDASQPDRWVAEAVDRRDDYRAALKLRESGGVLLRAARLGLKPRLDLGGRFWYNALAENSGSEALDGKWVGPSYSVNFDFEWPFANNTQEGRLLQAESQEQIQTIDATELGRRIRSAVVQAFGSLQETRTQVGLASEAVENYHLALAAEREKLRFNMSTLVDTLLTEQRLTEVRLSHASARRRYAQLLAQLRFETGTLISETSDGGRLVLDNLAQLPSRKADPLEPRGE